MFLDFLPTVTTTATFWMYSMSKSLMLYIKYILDLLIYIILISLYGFYVIQLGFIFISHGVIGELDKGLVFHQIQHTP